MLFANGELLGVPILQCIGELIRLRFYLDELCLDLIVGWAFLDLTDIKEMIDSMNSRNCQSRTPLVPYRLQECLGTLLCGDVPFGDLICPHFTDHQVQNG